MSLPGGELLAATLLQPHTGRGSLRCMDLCSPPDFSIQIPIPNSFGGEGPSTDACNFLACGTDGIWHMLELGKKIGQLDQDVS